MGSAIKFTGDQPEILNQWLSREQFSEIYPPGIRMFHVRNQKRYIYSNATWLETGFRMTIDRFRASWSFENNSWVRRCSCGMPKSNCAHTYALGLAIFDFLKIPKAAPRIPTRRPFDPPKYQANLPNAAKRPAPTTAPKLITEVDIKTSPGFVLVRFYLDQGERQLLKLSSVTSYSSSAKYSSNRGLKWSSSDREFLAWLAPKFNGRKLTDLSKLTALKISKAECEIWFEHWQQLQPYRFIERDTQQPINAANGVIKIKFELSNNNGRTTISAVCSMPNGLTKSFFELVKEISKQNRARNEQETALDGKYLIDGQVCRFDLPVSEKTMWDLFAKKNPSIGSEHVETHLGILLENRLDLVVGEVVKHEKKSVKPTLSATLLSTYLNFETTYKNKPIDNFLEISRNGEEFIISGYDFVDIDLINHFHHRFDFTENKSKVQLQSKNVSQIIELWDDISQRVKTKIDPRAQLLLEPQQLQASISATTGPSWVDVANEWKIADESFYSENITFAMDKKIPIANSKCGNWIRLDLDSILAQQKILKDNGIHFDHQRHIAIEANNILHNPKLSHFLNDIAVETSQQIERMMLPKLTLPSELETILRPYQKDGFNYLSQMAQFGVGSILADDMGLGKTLQILSLIKALKVHASGPTLVVAPASVLNVWKHEAETFIPDLQTIICHGTNAKRQRIINEADQYDLIITSYGAIRNDYKLFGENKLSLLVLDEAQYIRNSTTQIYQAVSLLTARIKLAVTGTPVENKLSDLWSIVNFINPGFLDTLTNFRKRFENDKDISQRLELANRVAPLILRRTKYLVAKELPRKTVETISIPMGEEQQKIYQEQLQKLSQYCQEKSGNKIQLLAYLTKLRQVCNSPKLLDYDVASTKLKHLISMLKELHEEGHSALIFSSLTSMLDLIRDEIDKHGIPHKMITGKTPVKKRQQLVDDFSNSTDAEVFLLSLKAAGTGLTLTKADYVFIFDPWWNPAAEAQAIDRTHRIGQTKPIIAYKMVAEHTIEEQILKLQNEKKELFDQVISDSQEIPSSISQEIINSLFDNVNS